MGAMDTLRVRVGHELGCSDWTEVDQEQVDRHADNTGDAQWIHNDPVRAGAEGPFGGPIAQGFLLLSLFTALSEQALPPVDGMAYLVNYGFDRVRFVRPVRVGDRVRLRLRLADLRAKRDGQWVVTIDAALESQAAGETAVAARWLFLAAESP